MSFLQFLRSNAPWLSAGALFAFLSSFGQTYFISVFAGEIRAEFQLSHGAWGTIYAFGTLASAAAMIWAGALTDRFRVRALGLLVLGVLATACLFMAINPIAAMLPVIVFLLRFTGQGMALHISLVSMSRWFVAERGRALSIAGLGIALGQAALPLLFVALMGVMHWRWLWVISAVVILICMPIMRMLLVTERTPQSIAEETQTVGMSGKHWTRPDVLKHWLFWFMVPALLAPPAIGTAFFFHQVHYVEVKGVSHLEFVGLLPLYTLASIGAMMASGWLLDKLGTPRLIPWFQVPMVLAFVAFALAGNIWIVLLGMLLYGATQGAGATLPSAFWAEFYGTKNLGAIKSMAAAIMVLGSAVGPWITGVLLDWGVGIETQYLWSAGIFLIATLLMVVGVGRAKACLQT